MSVDSIEPMPSAGPEPMVKGKFAIYETPGGGVHLVFQADGVPEPQHMEFPPRLVKMFARGGNPLAMLKGMLG